MAILNGVPGVEARVCVNDKVAQEYTDVESSSTTDSVPSCYIEAITDAPFTVTVDLGPQLHQVYCSSYIKMRLSIDGEDESEILLKQPRVPQRVVFRHAHSHDDSGQAFLHPLSFCKFQAGRFKMLDDLQGLKVGNR